MAFGGEKPDCDTTADAFCAERLERKTTFASPPSQFLTCVYYLQSSSHSVDTNGGSGDLRYVKCFGLVNSRRRVHLRVNCHKSS